MEDKRFASRSSDNWMELTFHPGQLQVWNSTADIVLLLAGTQALDVETPILTNVGYRRMFDIQIGDIVFDENGKRCNVIDVSPIYVNHECYQLIFSDGEKIIADEGHQWRVFGSETGRHIIKTTSQLLELVLQSKIYVDKKRWIKWINKVESVPVKCITVDSTSHLYLCGFNSVPTHNSGKTILGPSWMWREMQTRGPGDYLVVAPTFPLLSMKVLPEFLKLFKTQMKLGTFTGNPIRKFVLSSYGERSLWGDPQDECTQVFFGHANDPDSLESATAKACWCDEAGQRRFKLGSFEAIQRRLSVNRGRMLITTTPFCFGWLKTLLFDPWKLKKFKNNEVDVINFDSLMNPTFPREKYEQAKRSMPEWKFNMMYRGMFERPAGVIYDVFDTSIHKVPRFIIPDNWPRYVGIDFGGVNTAACFLAGETDSNGKETGRYFIYREYWPREGRTAKEHTYYILQNEPSVPFCVGGSHSEDQWRKEFRSSGEVDVKIPGGKERCQIPSLHIREPRIKEVDVGIQLVYGAIKHNQLFIFEDCKYILDEIESYSYKLDDNGEVTDDIEDKAMYHLSDSLRYVISHLKKPRQEFRIY